MAAEGKDGQTGAESLARSIYRHAKMGNGRMAQLLAERTGGSLPQSIELSGPDGGPMQFAGLSAEELAEADFHSVVLMLKDPLHPVGTRLRDWIV
jgi:hypothetical protein